MVSKGFTHFLLILCVCSCSTLKKHTYASMPTSVHQRALARANLGLAYLEQGQVAQAENNLNQALQLVPDDQQIQLAMIAFFMQTDAHQKAKQLYDSLLARYPDDHQILHNYGTFLCQQGEYRSAIGYFQQAIRSGDAADSYENMARCAAKHGFLSESIASLQNLIQVSPNRTDILLEFGHWFIKNEQWPQVTSVIHEYEKIVPVSAELLWLKLQLALKQKNQMQVTQLGEQLTMLYPFSQPAKRYLSHEY